MSDSENSGSAPPTPGSARSDSPAGSARSGSHASRSPGPGSPVSHGSGSAPASPGSVASRSPGGNSPIASPIASPGSVKSGSASPRSGSPQSHRSGSPQSPASHRSRSGSPASHGSRSHSGSPARQASRSPSPEGQRSRSGSPLSQRSRSGSPEGHKSGSASPGSHRSRSGSPKGSIKSRSPSRSVSPAGSRSRSRSATPAGSIHSRSRSPTPTGRSRSRSGSRSRSRSRTPAGSARSGSRSPVGSGSPGSAGSGSPAAAESKKKKKRLIDSDDDDEGGGSPQANGEITATADDLFGDASDISSDDEAKASGDEAKRSDRGSDAGSGDEQRPVIEDDENQEPEEIPETRIEVEIPKVNTDLGKSIHFVKLPNFLSVETRPFDPMTYEDEIDDEDVMDEEGRTRLRLKVENTMRWRPVKDEEGNEKKDVLGNPERESNARIVRWSDGSMSLHLGNEIFDVHTMLLQGDYNHLFIRQGTGLQGQAVFRTKLSFRPHSTDSFTHRKMTMSLADKSAKKQKLKVLPIAGADPETHRSEMIKKEEERLRASIRREAHQKRVKERAHARGVNTSYLEDDMDDDENSFSIGALKRAYKDKRAGKAGKANPHIYSSDDDSDDDFSEDEKKSKKLMKAKRLEDTDEESHKSGSGSGSDSDVPKKRSRVESSGSDAGSATGSPKSSPKNTIQESESDG